MTACDSRDYPGGPPCPRSACVEIVGIRPGPLGDEGETIGTKCDYHAGTYMASARGATWHGYQRVEAFDL